VAGAPAADRHGHRSVTPYAVCLVCTGNICRSPMAEVVLRRLAWNRPFEGGTLADRLRITSGGTGPWHVGEGMDPRARAALAARGYQDHGHVARQVDGRQLRQVDLVVALDHSHLVTGAVLLRSFDPAAPQDLDVPDPYYDGSFDECLATIEAGCRGLVEWLADRLG
jgi:protein-tyrosine phosphatase